MYIPKLLLALYGDSPSGISHLLKETYHYHALQGGNKKNLYQNTA